MPVRKIGINGRSVTGMFTSLKTGRTHMVESTLELEFLYPLEFDPLVIDYDAQPVTIFYVNHSGERVKYVPDFKVIYSKEGVKLKGHKFSLVELKYLHELEEDKEILEPKFNAARNYCDDQNANFEIFHEGIVKSTKLRNYKFLYRYLKPDRVPKLKIDFKALAKKLGTFTADEWMDNIDGSALLKGKALSNLWSLVAKGELHIDWDTPVTNTSVITYKES